MTEIANGTFNYATLNEIMPMIYKRFTEKAAEEWRQIYKALQLLEFLIKNGSERVIDDARSHLSLLKMLRQFHYIDQNGKDQGINVRNRAKELAELLGDVDRIRQERKKARQTRGKYGGVEGGAGIGGSGSSRYGGFGSETGPGSASFGGFSGGVYGDGGGFGGATESDYDDTQGRRDRFEEYDEYDEGGSTAPSRRRPGASTTASARKAEPPKPKEPEEDLFDFGPDEPAAVAPVSNGKAAAPSSAADDFGGFSSAAGDDDFDDFQSATQTSTTQSSIIPPPASTSTTTNNTQFAAPKPMGGQTQDFNNFFASTISPPPSGTATPAGANYSAFKSPPLPASVPQQPMQASNPSFQQPKSTPSTYQPAQPNYFGSVPAASATPTGSQTGGLTSPPASKSTASTKSSSGSDPFANLGIGGGKKAGNASSKGPSMSDMAKQKTSASVWGTPAQPAQQQQQRPQPSGGSGDDLLGL